MSSNTCVEMHGEYMCVGGPGRLDLPGSSGVGLKVTYLSHVFPLNDTSLSRLVQILSSHVHS